MRVLIIGKNLNRIDEIKSCLNARNYITDVIQTYKQGIYLAETYSYDIIILSHIVLSRSVKVCSALRNKNIQTPVIVVTRESCSDDRVYALDYGADDCISSPFDCKELVARVRALVRRPYVLINDALTVGNLTVDTKNCIVNRNNRDIYLTRKEFCLLEFLIRNKNHVLSRISIMEHVWGIHADIFSNTLESHIRSVRKKIKLEKELKLIITVPGRGYKIQEPF